MLVDVETRSVKVADDLVSVIMAVYQGERYVRGAIRSVLAQTYHNIEVLIVDDGSTDETAAVLATFSDPRVIVMSQANAGTAAARNAALTVATGKYVAFLDADDRWFPQKLEIEMSVLKGSPSPAIAYSSFYVIDDRGRLQRPGAIERTRGAAFEALLEGDNFLVPSLCLVDRRIFAEVGLFDTTRYHEDFDFFLRATRTYPVLPTSRRLGLFRHSTDGKCRGILVDFERARREELELVDGLGGTLTQDEKRRLRASVLRSLFERFLTYGFASHARRLMPEVDSHVLARRWKGRLALVFAWTGINALAPARLALNALCSIFLAGHFERKLRRMNFDVDYD